MQRDPNRQLVYDAELEAWGARMLDLPDARLDYLQRIADGIVSGPTWATLNQGSVRTVLVHGGRKRNGADCKRSVFTAEVRMAKGARNLPFLLHELAHALAPMRAQHNREFCVILVQLAGAYYGPAVSKRLEKALLSRKCI